MIEEVEILLLILFVLHTIFWKAVLRVFSTAHSMEQITDIASFQCWINIHINFRMTMQSENELNSAVEYFNEFFHALHQPLK